MAWSDEGAGGHLFAELGSRERRLLNGGEYVPSSDIVSTANLASVQDIPALACLDVNEQVSKAECNS